MRGFGTAVMHGGVAALFAILSQTLTERQMKINPLRFLPGLAAAVILHSAFNHFLVAPVLQTIGTILILPPLLGLVMPLLEKPAPESADPPSLRPDLKVAAE